MKSTVTAALAAFALTGAAASAQDALLMAERFDEGAPEAMWSGDLLLGEDAGWAGEVSGGRYTLSNTGDPGGARYVFTTGIDGVAPETLADAAVSVTVESAPTSDPAGGGLIYRFDPEARTYYAFTVTGEGAYSIWVREPDGLRQAMSGSNSDVGEGPYHLLAAPEGDAVAFSVNGVNVATLSNTAITGYGFGVYAIGSGVFSFDDFEAAAAQ